MRRMRQRTRPAPVRSIAPAVANSPMGAPGPPADPFATATGVAIDVLDVDGGDVVDGEGSDVAGIVVVVGSGAVVDAGTEVVGGTVVVGETVVVVVVVGCVVVVVEEVVVLDVVVEGSEGVGLPPRAESTSADKDPTT